MAAEKDRIVLQIERADGSTLPLLSLPRRWLRRLSLGIIPLMIALAIGAVVAISLYVSNLDNIKGYDRLVKQAAEMEAQLDFFNRRVAELTDRLTALQESNARIRVLANLEARPGQVERRGIGGPDAEAAMLTTDSLDAAQKKAVERLHRDLQELELNLAGEAGASDYLQDYLQKKQTVLNFTPSIMPVRGWISSRYGYRVSPFTGRREFHKGVDIVNRRGTPVVATADGRVKFAGYNGGYGRMVVIDHGIGLATKYGHLSKIYVKIGDRVVRGQKIGLVGNSGRSTGPHLHYEVVVNGQSVNPVNYFVN